MKTLIIILLILVSVLTFTEGPAGEPTAYNFIGMGALIALGYITKSEKL